MVDESRLPKKLGKCRFTTRHPVSNILPGILFSESFGEGSQLERLLPQSEIPEAIRNTDPSLQYAPLVRIREQDYSFLIGDRSVAVACNFPYKGWEHFKSKITMLINTLSKSKLIDKVTRYSTKYVNLIQSTDPIEQVNLVNLSLKIGNHSLKEEVYQVRMEIPRDGFISVIQVISGVKVTMLSDGTPREGVVIDIDTIKGTDGDGILVEQLEQDLNKSLDEIHTVSKKTFFDCLTKQTRQQLEPEYE